MLLMSANSYFLSIKQMGGMENLQKDLCPTWAQKSKIEHDWSWLGAGYCTISDYLHTHDYMKEAYAGCALVL
jgi:hypothetical protein